MVEKAAEALQLYVRVKAADRDGIVSCVSCGVRRHYKDRMQGGHFIQRKWLATKLLEENVHPQCAECNGGFGVSTKGNMVGYTLFMEDTYGRDFINHLEVLKHETRKYYRNEVEEIISDLKDKTQKLQEEKGI